MAAAGGAVGLGNIWKFPYIAGENGGGTFLLVYLLCVLLFGLPLMVMEFMIGKRSGKSTYGAFRALSGSNRWQWMSWVCMLTAMGIMGFYFVVTGWCFNYLIEALVNAFEGLDAVALTEHFGVVSRNVPRMIGFTVLPVLLTAAVLWFDVNKGIERLSKILMPMLLLMAGRVLMLDGSNVGMQFFFQFDFTKITSHVVMEAMGQCFFSLSMGMGALITYGAYMPKGQNVPAASLQVIVLDTLVAILAGVIIFPAVFAFGVSPAQGAQLVFVVLPAVLQQMSFAWLSSVLFFGLLCIAALTSTISLMEVAVAFVQEATASTRHPLSRRQSVSLVATMVLVLITLCIFFPAMFDLSDHLTAGFSMPLTALCMAIFVGWALPKSGEGSVLQHTKGAKRVVGKVFLFFLRWIIPLFILLVFLNGLGILSL